jgi:ATP-dependent Clp protease ATP-binding subunit ClpC
VRRYLDSAVVAPVARLLARSGPASHAGTLWVGETGEPQPRAGRVLGRLSAGELDFVLMEGQQKQARRDARHAVRIAEMRRQMDRHLALDRVEQLRSQLQMVQASLNIGGVGSARQRKKGRKRDLRTTEDLARLAQEHHRMQEVLQLAQGSREALVAAEEVSLMALLSGDETVEFLTEAEAADREFQGNLAKLLLAQETHRDEATFIIQEVQPWGAFGLWLMPLLKSLKARGWTAELHVAGEIAKPEDKWHELSPWGPPRSAKKIIERYERKPFNTGLLLRIKGPYAGCLLALEQGLHRFDGRAKGGGHAGLFIQLVAMRYDFEDPKDWTHDEMAPLPDPLHSHHTKTKPIRRHHPGRDRLELLRAAETIFLPLQDYWKRFEEVAIAELLAFETDLDRDRDRFFMGSLEGGGSGVVR